MQSKEIDKSKNFISDSNYVSKENITSLTYLSKDDNIV